MRGASACVSIVVHQQRAVAGVAANQFGHTSAGVLVQIYAVGEALAQPRGHHVVLWCLEHRRRQRCSTSQGNIQVTHHTWARGDQRRRRRWQQQMMIMMRRGVWLVEVVVALLCT